MFERTPNDTPTFEWVPDGDTSMGEEAVELAAHYGLTPDPWQEHVIKAWLRTGADGKWVAGRVGCAIPRQQGKNAILEVVQLYMLSILGLRILATAHEVKTSRKAFLRLASFFENDRDYPELAELVKSIRKANGQEAIFLNNGGSIEFIARSKNSGRGFTVDVLVCDESQEFPEDAQAALLPTISAAPSGDPIQIMVGTPPGPKDNGEVFARMHSIAHERIDPRLSWVEWAAVGEIDTEDRSLWARINPALGRRLVLNTLIDEFGSMSREMFARERLGMWSSDKELSVIPQADWDACLVDEAPEGQITAIGLDMDPERTAVVVAVAVKTESGTHVELARIDEPDSTVELVNWISQRARRRIPVVVDAYSPARSLEPGLKQKKCRTFALAGNELMQACGGFYDAVTQDRTVTHIGQEQLDASLAGAKRQSIGDAGGWKWSRKELESDLVPIMAVTCAWFGAQKFAKPVRSNNQKGRVLLG
jgi:hypothetical protein